MTTGRTPLERQVAMVTGGASGISRAMAIALGKAGARIWIADIDGNRTSQAVDEFRGDGIYTDGLRLDVTDRRSVEDAVMAVYWNGDKTGVTAIIVYQRALECGMGKGNPLRDISSDSAFLKRK